MVDESREIHSGRLSRVAVGCEQLGGADWGEVDLSQVQAGIRAAWERGIDTFDTATVYGLGRSEEALAKTLGEDRHAAIIATKCGYRWHASDAGRATPWLDGSPEAIIDSVHASLRRLRLDRLKLLQLHRPDPKVPIEESVGAMTQLVTSGLVGAIGLSNVTAGQLRAAGRVASIATVQMPYSLLHRDVEAEILPFCRAQGIGVLAYGTIAHGLLSGKYTEADRFPPTDRRQRLPDFQGARFVQNLAVAQRVSDVARRRGISAVQVAIAWTLHTPGVTTAIAGFKAREQLLESLEAASVVLTEREREFLEGRRASFENSWL